MARELKDEIQAEEPVQEEVPTQKHPLQLDISEDGEKHLLMIVQEDYDSALDARNKLDYGITSKGETITFTKWLKGIRDLYNSRRIPKTTPWKYCSNRSLRIAASILDMLHARLLPTIIDANLLKWNPGEKNDTPKVQRISELMKWWIWVRCRLREFFDNFAKLTIGYGDSMTECFWDIEIIDTGRTLEEPVMDEMGQPMMEQDGNPAVTKQRVIDFKEKGASKVYMKENVYLQQDAKSIDKEPVILEDNYLYRDLEEGEAQGAFTNVQNQLKERLSQGYDLAGSNMDEDEKRRFIDVKLRNQPVKVLKWYGHFDADGDGFAEDVRVYVCLEHRLYLGGTAVKNLTKTGKRPLVHTKYDSRFDRPFDLDGEGVLEKVKELAEEVDAIFNQMTDANTLSVLRPGYYDPSGDVDAPAMTLAPNRMMPVSDPQRNIAFPDISVNIEPLLKAIRLVLEFIERLTASSAYVFGKESEIVGGSGTATRTNAIMQSAEARFALPAQRLRDGTARIMQKHLDLLQLNIPPGLESRVLGEKGEPVFESGELSQEGIAGEFDAYLLPDPAMGSKQLERDLAGMMYSMLLQNIIVGTDPAKIYKITADLIRAHDKDPEEYLGPAPPSDDIDDPQDENTLLIQGDFQRVRAQITENHLYHMKTHMDLMQSPSLQFLQQSTPNLFQEVIQALQAHIMEHEQMMQVMMSMVGKFGGGGGQQGSAGGATETTKGAPNASGVEQSSGPMGQALNAKRTGESGPTPQG